MEKGGTTVSVTDEIYYDPYDYQIDAYPHPVWKRMRDEAPLYYNPVHNFYAVSRYHDVRDLSADWRTYSSAKGSVLELIDAEPEVLELNRNMLFEDPPIHDEHRAILARSFTPRRISALEPQIRALCRRYLDEVPSERFDLVRDYGAKLPMMVIGMLLGVPEEDREFVRTAADELVHRDEGDTEYGTSGQRKMLAYFSDLVAERRQHPTDDIISDLTHAEVKGKDGSTRYMDNDELLRYISLVAAAGNETVTNLMGWAGLTLWRHPDQRQLLIDDPGLIPTAVEELLRYEAPSPIQARLVMRDVELHGKTVRAGSKMALLTGSAGRDERAYPDPDRFDVTRTFDNHVSFGHGIHFCLGAALARLEGRVGIEEMIARHPVWEVDEDQAEMVHTSTVRGWATLPVAV
jgi:cytochrome P450